jgi:hypothetical protein
MVTKLSSTCGKYPLFLIMNRNRSLKLSGHYLFQKLPTVNPLGFANSLCGIVVEWRTTTE